MLDQQDLQKIGEVVDAKLDKRFDDFEVKFDAKLDKRFDDFEVKFDAKLDKRFGDFEVKMNEGFDELRFMVNQSFSQVQEQFVEVNQRIDKLYSLTDGYIALHRKLDQELTMLSARVGRIEEQMQKMQGLR